MKNKALIELFKKSMREVSEVLKLSPSEIKRDEYIRVAIDNKISRLNKEQLNELGGYGTVKALFFPKVETKKIEESSDIRQDILKAYGNYVSKYGITPTQAILQDLGFSSSSVNKVFVNFSNLYTEASEEYPEIFSKLVNDSVFTEKSFSLLKNKVNEKSTFIITTAVNNKKIHEGFLNSLETFKKERDALIIIQPCEDVIKRESSFSFELDPRLKDCEFAFKDLYLNNNILLSSIKVSAKQINPLTGLQRLAQAKGSMILASPKQYLEFIANSNTKLPRALMTTGAITVSDYSTDFYMSQRTSYLADFDHLVGAIIVEIEDGDIFHFRQIQAEEDGSFIDLGVKYSPNGKISEVTESVCVFGDTHVGSHDLEVDQCLAEITDKANCKEIIVHDIFDCRFNNHHDQTKKATRAQITMAGKSSMMYEAKITAEWLNLWSNRVDNITIVKSNHDEALERYIDEGRWKDDAENLYYAVDLVKKFIEKKDVLKHLIVEMVGIDSPDSVKWLDRDEDYIVYGVENGAHGDKGANGSKGSMRGIEKAYHKATVGHSHTAGIWRQVYQVGTSTTLKLSYNSGPSSWTQTMCIQYPNGSRQLINIIRTKNGRMSWHKSKK